MQASTGDSCWANRGGAGAACWRHTRVSTSGPAWTPSAAWVSGGLDGGRVVHRSCPWHHGHPRACVAGPGSRAATVASRFRLRLAVRAKHAAWICEGAPSHVIAGSRRLRIRRRPGIPQSRRQSRYVRASDVDTVPKAGACGCRRVCEPMKSEPSNRSRLALGGDGAPSTLVRSDRRRARPPESEALFSWRRIVKLETGVDQLRDTYVLEPDRAAAVRGQVDDRGTAIGRDREVGSTGD